MAHIEITAGGNTYAFDSEANFTNNNPVLGAGVMAYAFQPGGGWVNKKGDGTSGFNSRPITLYPIQLPPALFKLAYDAITAHGDRLNDIETKVPVPITPITGGSQGFSVLALADVTGSSINLAATTTYEVEWIVTHSAAATTTGAFFSVNGTAGASYFTVMVIGDTLAADGNARAFNAPGGGSAFASSRATSGNKALIRVNIRTTTAGTIVLRCASEVNASAITITALQGYSKVV